MSNCFYLPTFPLLFIFACNTTTPSKQTKARASKIVCFCPSLWGIMEIHDSSLGGFKYCLPFPPGKGRKAEHSSYHQSHLVGLSSPGNTQALCKTGHLAQTCAGTFSGQEDTVHMWTQHCLDMRSVLKAPFGFKTTTLFQNPHLSSMQGFICCFWEELHHTQLDLEENWYCQGESALFGLF